ncbi:PTS sugar transporter subunit IIB, partial [Klebsiella pneumoniae]|nr:PTS sugar transporter subunit IIB [Klebsiella pneumoniae]
MERCPPEAEVVFAWTRALDIDHIIVANAKAAAD